MLQYLYFEKLTKQYSDMYYDRRNVNLNLQPPPQVNKQNKLIQNLLYQKKNRNSTYLSYIYIYFLYFYNSDHSVCKTGAIKMQSAVYSASL